MENEDARNFFVIDEDNFASFSDDSGEGESFATQTEAMARAHALAKMNPDQNFIVCASITMLWAPVGDTIEFAVNRLA